MPLPARIKRAVPGKSVVKAEEKERREARSHVELVKMLPCAATLKHGPSDPHHLMRVGPGERGMSLTTAGRWTIPLCRRVHMEITPHGDPEAVLMERYGIPARELAEALWSVSPDVEAMLRIVQRHHWDAQIILRRAILA
jgi:hypothetical protein